MEGQRSDPLQTPLLPTEDSYGDLRQGGGAHPYRVEEMLEEAKRQVYLAGPLIAVNLLQNSLQAISLMFVGHLGELSLSGASMATSFASFTGFSVLLGMGSALETLCGQAYGAKQYHLLGIYTQRAILTLSVLTIPLGIIWWYTTNILSSLGQDHEISVEAGRYNRLMIPGLFAYALLQCLNRLLQTQNIVVPMMIFSGITALFHFLLCWLLVVKFAFGTTGAAIASAISQWINVIFTAIYIKFSPSCMKTWTGFSKEAFYGIFSFLKLAIPSTIMIWRAYSHKCKIFSIFEYWSFDLVVLLSGRLSNPKLETSVLSISLNTCWMVYMISVGLGGAISTRVSNELGAGRSRGARLALCVVVVIAIVEGVTVGIITILVRHVWGKLFSNEDEVIQYVSQMMLLLSLSDFLDGFQCVLSGAARGCGWQNVCACINLVAYYVIGIPSSVLFAFFFGIGGMGLWMGIICGLSVQVIALVTVNLCTNWNNEASKAVNRVERTEMNND